MTATLQREQYSSFFAFSSSDSTEGEASWEGAGGRGAGQDKVVTGAGAEDTLEEEDNEEEERPGAGSPDGGLDGGGSLPALLEEGEEEERGEVEGRRKDLTGDGVSAVLDKKSVC